MANPMQRRAKMSFLIGFFIALVIMAVVVGILMVKISKQKDRINEIESKQSKAYVANVDFESGAEITSDDLVQKTVQTQLSKSDIISSEDLPATELDENDKEKSVKYYTKINIPAGTIITKDMIYSENDKLTDDQRIKSFGVFELPYDLKNGDYVDLRLQMPSGEDYIILAKKKIEGCTSNIIWLKISEEELLTLNGAIIESWMITGSKLYAIKYAEAGMQAKAKATYLVSETIYNQMRTDENIVEEASKAILDKYQAESDKYRYQRMNVINPAVDLYSEDRDSIVAEGNSAEYEKIQELREEYVTNLDSDKVGYSSGME